MENPLSYQARREVLQQAAPQYREASSSQKRMLLDAFVATTGYHRTYARRLLNHAEEVQQTHGCSQLRTYGPEVQHALFLAWHTANRRNFLSHYRPSSAAPFLTAKLTAKPANDSKKRRY